jgi:predicted Zn-dependent protease
MRWQRLIGIMALLIASCRESTPPPAIPTPANLSAVDPLIAELIQRTAAEVRDTPRDANAWAQHASALLANAYYQPSVAASRVALSIDPSRTHVQYRQGIVLWRLNQQDEAIAELRAVLEASPAYDCGWRRLAQWHLERGELDAASTAIDHAIARSPNRPGTLSTLVRLRLQQGRPQDALLSLQPRLDRSDTPGHVYFLASQAYRQLGDTTQAQEAAALSEPLPKKWPDPWLNEILPLATGKRMLATNALEMLQTRGPKAAIPLLARAVEADPTNVKVRGALATALIAMRQPRRAVQVLDALPTAVEPTDGYWIASANAALAMAKVEAGDRWRSKAAIAFQRAEALTGGSPRLYRSMARLAAARGEFGEAARCYQAGAQMLIAQGEHVPAKDFLAEGITKIPNDQTLRVMLEQLVNTP